MDSEIDREFAAERRNLQLGLSLDGVNPFSMQESNHSTWPVMVILYNLLFWLVTKLFCVSLSTTFWKESPTSENTNVFWTSMVEELLEL